MQLDISEASLATFEALASDVRLKIIQILSLKKMNIKELATELNLSSAIISKHIKKLEEAELIKTERIPGVSGLQKVSILKVDQINVVFPTKIYPSFEVYESSIPIGHYTDYQIQPTCGLADDTDFIGQVDEPRFFMDSRRMNANILWFTSGYVEYKTPNLLPSYCGWGLAALPLRPNLNDIKLGIWSSPGDFADTRGKLNPDYWPDNLNQYGLLKTIRITKHGTYIDGDLLSDITVDDIHQGLEVWNLKFEVNQDAENVGGLTLFGKNFGNHEQDIVVKTYYS